MAERPTNVDRRSFLKLTGAGAVLLTTGSTSALAQESELKQNAKAAVAEQQGANTDETRVMNEATVSYDASGERYYVAKVMDGDGQIQRVMLDGNGSEVDRDAVRSRADAAYREENGRFGSRLSEMVEDAAPDDEIDAVVWTDGIDRDAARRAVGAQKAKDTTEDRKVLAKENQARIEKRTKGMARSLEAVPGVTIRSVGSIAETVKITASSEALEKVQQRRGVWRVLSDEGEWGETLDDAAKTQETWDGRDGKYDASDYSLGVFEMYSYPEENGINLKEKQGDTHSRDGDHGHKVALAAAAKSSNNPGSAKGAGVYAAVDPWENLQDKVEWMDNKGVSVINFSVYYEQDGERPMNSSDFEFGQFVRNRYLNIAVSAGNEDQVDNGLNVTSPSKGFNQISVGATSNHGDGDKSNDERRSTSCYKNPRSEHDYPKYGYYPHEKPEVSAVGSGLDSDEMYLGGGTSLSSPQLAGIITLIDKFGDDYGSRIGFSYYPEVVKPILLAAATNFTGYIGDVGAGNVVATVAEEIVENETYEYSNYWEGNDSYIYDATFEEGEQIRVALSWLSDVTDSDFTDNGNASSDISLDLLVYDKDGNVVDSSTDYDAGFQFLDYETAPYTGSYTIEVQQDKWDTSDSYRPFGLAWHGN